MKIRSPHLTKLITAVTTGVLSTLLLSHPLAVVENVYQLTQEHGSTTVNEPLVLSKAFTLSPKVTLGSFDFSSRIVGTSTSSVPSGWLDEDKNEMFPAGSKQVVVEHYVENISDKTSTLTGLYSLGKFAGTDHYSAVDLNSVNPAHVKLGYSKELEDQFAGSDEWFVQPGGTIRYAETLYAETSGEYTHQFFLNGQSSPPVTIYA